MQGLRHNRKVRTGVVVSDKMEKTVVVKVLSLMRHPVYKKVTRRYKKFKVHDENKIAKVGQVVKIMETRPISKEKRWRIAEVVK